MSRTAHSYFTKAAKVVLLSLISLLILSISVFASKDSSPENKSKFCINCHTMEAEFNAWLHSSHRREMCVDCHLPHENMAVYYIWKSIDGLKDVIVFYSGQVPDRISISSHGKKVLQGNCIRCHETTVMLIDKSRKCWDCHRRVSHKNIGIRQTL